MRKNLFFLGIDIPDVLTLCNSYIKDFDIKLITNGDKLSIEGKDTQKFCKLLNNIFGDKVTENLANYVVKKLSSMNQKITTAESCTGGLLAYQFTCIAGASNIYDGGIISYSNFIKHKYLKVKNNNLQNYGAVSEIVVEEMLRGALEMFDADYALATSGIAGPSGGSIQKPVGTVYIGMQKHNSLPIIQKCLFKGDRKSIQEQSCVQALKLLAINI